MGTTQPRAPTRAQLLRQAWPYILANAAVPALGLADTAIIGHTGRVDELGAIALGALIFNFVYWGFGFLRMGTTGFVAQASGAGDGLELRCAIGRSLVLGAALGATLIVLQIPLAAAALALLNASPAVEAQAAIYVEVRIWAAPASLMGFAITGALVGLGASKKLLVQQLALNGINIALDIWLAGFLDLGALGIAWGTTIAEWTSLLIGTALLASELRREGQHGLDLPWRRIFELSAFAQTLRTHRDIMIRTLVLIASFAFFTDRGAQFGDETLAANHILLQLVSTSAYFLDGYAFVAESAVGRAIGARDRARFDIAVRRTSELAGLTALGLAGLAALAGPWAIAALTDHRTVADLATQYLSWAAIYIAASFPAFQLDGIFIGATRTAAMRNAAIASMAIFLATWWLLRQQQNAGLWTAMIAYVVARAIALGVYFPALRRSIAADDPGTP